MEKELDDISGEVPLGDRKNMVFSGSFVTYGRAAFLVTGIGMDTEMGHIATLLKNTEEKKTPLQVSLDQFGRKLSIIILVICALLFGVSVFLRDEPVMNAFLFAVALSLIHILYHTFSVCLVFCVKITHEFTKGKLLFFHNVA